MGGIFSCKRTGQLVKHEMAVFMCVLTLTDAAPFACVYRQESLAVVVFFELHLDSPQECFFVSSEGLLTCTAPTAFRWWFDHCPFVLVLQHDGSCNVEE